MEMPPTVFVVDSDAKIRSSIAELVASMELTCRTYATGDEFLRTFDPRCHGCLLLAVKMPSMDGLEVQRLMQDPKYRIPTIMITAYGDIPTAVQAIKNGAIEFMEKPIQCHLLVDKIRRALEMDQQYRHARESAADLEDRFSKLTTRESQVVEMVTNGKTTKQIASDLGVSPQAIDAHRGRAMTKLGIESVAGLTRLVLQKTYMENPSATDPFTSLADQG